MHYNISLEFRMSFLTVIREMKKNWINLKIVRKKYINVQIHEK